MYKKVLFFVLLCPLVVRGQLLSVTATLTDSDGTVWANGTCAAEIYSPNGIAYFGNTPIPIGPQPCAIDGSGVLTTSIYNTFTITPQGAQYRFRIASATSAPATSVLTSVGTANMTATLSALLVAPRFNASVAYVYGYNDIEAVATQPGAQYYKTIAPVGYRVFSGGTGGTWSSAGGGGGTGAPNPGVANQLYKSDGAGGWVVSTFRDNGGSGDTVSLSSLPFNAPAMTTGFITINGNGANHLLLTNGSTQNGMAWDAVGGSHEIYAYTSNLGWQLLDLAGTAILTVPNDDSLHTTAGVVPSIDPAITVGQTVCVKALGPPLVIGKCTSVVGAGGACTCA